MKAFKISTIATFLVVLFSCQKEELSQTPIDTLKTDKEVAGRTLLSPSLRLDFELESSRSNMGGYAGQAMTLFKGFLWIVGGDNGNTDLWTSGSEVWRSHDGKEWKRVTSKLFDERTNHSLLVYKNKMWLIGGINNAGEILSDIWNTSDGIHWQQVRSLNPLLDIGQNNSIVFNDRIYVFRGNGSVNQEVWSTGDGSNWRLETDNAFPVRSHYKTIVFNGLMYVIGGWIRDGNLTNEVWASRDGSHWYQERSVSTIFQPRLNHTTTVFDGKVWIIGGESWDATGKRTFYGDVWYSTNMKSWSKYDDKPPFYKGLHSHESLAYKNKLWIFGGYRPDSSMSGILTDNTYSLE